MPERRRVRRLQPRRRDIARAQLVLADLSYADLQGADLREADVSGTNFRNANLGHARLGFAKCRPVALTDASGEVTGETRATSFAGASLRNADLANVGLPRRTPVIGRRS